MHTYEIHATFSVFFLLSRLLFPPSSSLPHPLFPPFLFSPLPPYFLMLSPFFLSLAFLPLLLPFPYLNFPLRSAPPFPFCTFPLFPSLLLLFQLLSLSSLPGSPSFPIFLFYLFPIHSCFFQPSHFFCFNFSCSLLFYDLNFTVPSLPRTLFPLSFPHFNFAILFPPRLFPSLPLFLSSLSHPNFLSPSFSAPTFPCHLFFRFCYLAFSYLHPLSMPQFFSYPSPFSSPRCFPLPPILTPPHACRLFYASRTGEEIQKYNFLLHN